jgi:hypothetical protein
MGDRFKGTLLGVIEGCTNPESAELLDDGETIIFGNCRLDVGFGWFREGQGLVYLEDQAFISRARVSRHGDVTLEERGLITGLTTTLGCDVMRTDATALPEGAVLMAAGGKPVTRDGSGPAQARPHVLAFDPATGDILGRIALGEGSRIAERFEPLEMPNGLAVDQAGNLYVTDCPHTNPAPDPAAPPPSSPAVYRIPVAALGPLLRDEPGAADTVTRVVMPGYVNGATISPLDGTCYAVSCSPVDPVRGGVYRLPAGAFASGVQPPPLHRDLGQLDGVGVTRRGTVLAGTPLENKIHAFTPDGEHGLITGDGLPCRMPADFNVVYPRCLDGEPALLITDIMVGTAPGDCTVSVLAIPGL